MAVVLICDDDTTIQELISKTVRREGHTPICASSGAEALRMADELIPSMIFLDVVMPIMDGFKTLRKLKKQESTANIPVVLCTSKGTDTDKVWGERNGASHHIVKPFKAAHLTKAMSKFIA